LKNINDESVLKKVDNLEVYLQEVLVFGGKGGVSDITLRHKITGKWFSYLPSLG
jgi:hypothetical protein